MMMFCCSCSGIDPSGDDCLFTIIITKLTPSASSPRLRAYAEASGQRPVINELAKFPPGVRRYTPEAVRFCRLFCRRSPSAAGARESAAVCCFAGCPLPAAAKRRESYWFQVTTVGALSLTPRPRRCGSRTQQPPPTFLFCSNNPCQSAYWTAFLRCGTMGTWCTYKQVASNCTYEARAVSTVAAE